MYTSHGLRTDDGSSTRQFPAAMPFAQALDTLLRHAGHAIPVVPGSVLVLRSGDVDAVRRRIPQLHAAADPFHARGTSYQVNGTHESPEAYVDLGQGRISTPVPRFVPVPSDMTVGDYVGQVSGIVSLMATAIEIPVREETTTPRIARQYLSGQ